MQLYINIYSGVLFFSPRVFLDALVGLLLLTWLRSFDGNKLGSGFFVVYVNGMENVWEILYKSKNIDLYLGQTDGGDSSL